MPRIKYFTGSLRCNFIARNVARENAPLLVTDCIAQVSVSQKCW